MRACFISPMPVIPPAQMELTEFDNRQVYQRYLLRKAG